MILSYIYQYHFDLTINNLHYLYLLNITLIKCLFTPYVKFPCSYNVISLNSSNLLCYITIIEIQNDTNCISLCTLQCNYIAFSFSYDLFVFLVFGNLYFSQIMHPFLHPFVNKFFRKYLHYFFSLLHFLYCRMLSREV